MPVQQRIKVKFDHQAFAGQRLNKIRGLPNDDKPLQGKPERKIPTLGADALLIATTGLRKQFHLARVAHSSQPTPGVETFDTHPRGLTDIEGALAAFRAVPGVTDASLETLG